jgi:hypothetical protein
MTYQPVNMYFKLIYVYVFKFNTVDSAYLQSLFVRENFAIKRTLR